MKITKKNTVKAELDFDTIVKDLIAKHGTIYFADINDEAYIYKPLSRKDYKEIVENDNLTLIEKEDEVCERTILWPENIDFDEVDAGVPTELYKQILTNSFLDSMDSVVNLIDVYREELETVDTQMSCIISEAFPNYDIEEIESWDMIKFCKIFSRAEWKLKTLRNMDNLLDIADVLRTYNNSNIENEEENIEYESEIRPQSKAKQQTGKVKVGSKEMTMDEYNQYLEFQRMYPDIDFGADAMFTGYETMTADTTAPALRTR